MDELFKELHEKFEKVQQSEEYFKANRLNNNLSNVLVLMSDLMDLETLIDDTLHELDEYSNAYIKKIKADVDFVNQLRGKKRG